MKERFPQRRDRKLADLWSPDEPMVESPSRIPLEAVAGSGLSPFTLATSSEKPEFRAGEYRRMMRTLEMSRPFLRVFQRMGRVKLR